MKCKYGLSTISVTNYEYLVTFIEALNKVNFINVQLDNNITRKCDGCNNLNRIIDW